MSLKTHSRQGRNKDFSFTTGNLVLVKWGDGMVYFAKVKRIDTKKQKCTVVFDDKSQDEADFSQIHSVDETTTDIICIKCKKDNSDSPNEIVLCDMCGIGFHQKCHVPPIPVSALQLDMPWNCSYCQQGVKCPFLTESLDVLQNLLSDDNEATSGDEEDGGGMESEYHEVVRDDSSSSRRGRKRKGRSSLHARQERRKSLRLHTPTPEVSSLVTTEKKSSSELHSPEAKDTSSDITKTDEKSPMSRKRKKLVHMKRMKRSSVESRTVSVQRIDTPIYEEAPPNFFSPFTPESDDYSPSKVMLSSVANTSPEKLEDSKGFDLETIPETPLINESPPKLKERQLRVSLTLHSDAVEKGSPGKSKLKSPLLFGSVTSWDDVMSPKNSEKSLSCESSPKSHQSRTESLKEEAFVASPLPSTTPKVLQQPKMGARSNSSTPVEPKSSPFSVSADTEISPVVKSVSSTIASLNSVTPEGTTPIDPISPAIPIDSGIPEPESASPPTPMDTSSHDAITTSVFSTEAHPSAITETIVVTSSTIMDVSEGKKECKGDDSKSPVISSASDVTATAVKTLASGGAGIASAGSNVPKFQVDVGVTGRARPSTLPTNPVAITSTKISQSTIVSQAPAPKSTAVITSKAVSSIPHAHKTGQKKSPVASQIKRESVSTEDVQSPLPGTVAAAKVTTTSPGKAQSPTTSKAAVLKHDLQQIPSKSDSKRTAEKKIADSANSSFTSQPITKPKPCVESPNAAATGGVTATPTSVITNTPQVPHHHKQMIKSSTESATIPKTAELKTPIPPQHDPTLLSKRLEEIVSRETLSDEASAEAEPDVIITAVEKNEPSENTRQTKDAGTATPGKASPKVSAQGQVFMPMVSQTAAVCGSVVQPVYYQVSSKEHPPQYTSNAQPVTHVLFSPNTPTLSHAVPTAGHPQPKAVVHHPSSGTAVYYTAVPSDSTAKSGMHPSSVATTKPYAIVNAIPTQPSGDVGYRPATFPEKVPGVSAEGGSDSSKHLHQQHGTVQVVQTAGGRVAQFVAGQSTQPGKVRNSEGNSANTPSSVSRPPPSYSSFVSEKSSAIDEDLQSIQKKIGDAFTQSSEVMLVSAFEDAWKKFQANERAYKEKTGSAVDKPFPAKIVSTEPSIPPNVVVHQPVVSRPRVTGPEKVARGMPTAPQRPIAPKYVHTAIATGPDGSQQQVALQSVGNTTMMYAIPAQAPAPAHPSTGKQQVHVTGLYYPATMDTAATSQQQSAPEQLQQQHPTSSVKQQHVQTSRAQPHHHHHHINRSQQGRGGGHTKPRGSVTGGGGVPQNRTTARKTSNNHCAKCGKSATYVCSGCRTEWYCSRDCQLRCWDTHSEVCTA